MGEKMIMRYSSVKRNNAVVVQVVFVREESVLPSNMMSMKSKMG